MIVQMRQNFKGLCSSPIPWTNLYCALQSAPFDSAGTVLESALNFRNNLLWERIWKQFVIVRPSLFTLFSSLFLLFHRESYCNYWPLQCLNGISKHPVCHCYSRTELFNPVCQCCSKPHVPYSLCNGHPCTVYRPLLNYGAYTDIGTVSIQYVMLKSLSHKFTGSTRFSFLFYWQMPFKQTTVPPILWLFLAPSSSSIQNARQSIHLTIKMRRTNYELNYLSDSIITNIYHLLCIHF